MKGFYPSLYPNMGKSHEDPGDPDGVRRCYELAAEKVNALTDEGYGGLVRRGINTGLGRIRRARRSATSATPLTDTRSVGRV